MRASADEASAWAAALAGDGRAFARVFDLHHERVFRHVIGLAEQRADTDEITAAAFFELWRCRRRVRLVDGSVLPWLLVTAGNLARNHGRAQGRYRRVLQRMPREDVVADAAEVVAARDESARRAAALAGALRRLKPVDAQLIALTTQAGLPVQEAAAALGLTPGAARVRLHRAHARLRLLLGPDLEPATAEGAAR